MESVRLKPTERASSKLEIITNNLLILVEIVKLILTGLNYQRYAEFESAYEELTVFTFVFIASLSWNVGFSIYVIYSCFRSTSMINRDLKHGIKVAKGRQRQKKTQVSPLVLRRSSKNVLDESKEHRLVEYELSLLTRHQKRSELMVKSGLLDDLLIIIILLYRISFTDTVFSKQVIECARSEDYVLDAPNMCFDFGIFIACFQVAFGTYILAYKVSYARDYFTLGSILNDKKKQLEREQEEGLSTLDRYKRKQVMDVEVFKVIEIRKLLGAMFSLTPSFGSDLQFLRSLRLMKNDPLVAAKQISGWGKWRDANKTTEMRRNILENDLPFINLPFMKDVISHVPMTFHNEIDKTHDCIVVYIDFENFCLEKLEKTIGGLENLKTAILYALEWFCILVDSSSEHSRRVLRVRILCNTKGKDLQNLEDENLAGTHFLNQFIIPCLRQYPLLLDILLWDPDFKMESSTSIAISSAVTSLIETEEEGGGATTAPGTKMKEETVTSTALDQTIFIYLQNEKSFLKKVEVTHLPKLIFNKLYPDDTLEIKKHENVWLGRTNEASVHLRLSKCLSSNTSIVSFFAGISPEEKQKVNQMYKLIRKYEKIAARELSKGKEKFLKYVSKCNNEMLQERAKHNFQNQGMAKIDQGYEQANEEADIAFAMAKLVQKGIYLRDLPVEIKGFIGLLRFLRLDPEGNMYVAMNRFYETVRWRKNNNVDEINKMIKEKTFKVHENEHFQLLDSSIGIHPLCNCDMRKGELVGLFFTNIQSQTKTSAENLETPLIWLLEYYNILSHQASIQSFSLCKVQGIIPYTSIKTSMAKSFMHLVESKLGLHYPAIFSKTWILIKEKPTISHFLNHIYHWRRDMELSRGSRFWILNKSKQVDVDCLGGVASLNSLPVSIGGKSSRSLSLTLEQQNIPDFQSVLLQNNMSDDMSLLANKNPLQKGKADLEQSTIDVANKQPVHVKKRRSLIPSSIAASDASHRTLKVHTEATEYLQLKSLEQRKARMERFRDYAFICVETAFATIAISNFILYISYKDGSTTSKSKSNTYMFAYIVNVAWVAISSSYMVWKHFKLIGVVSKEISRGILVEKGRLRQLKKKDQVLYKHMDPMMEYQLTAIKRRKERAKLILLNALFEDSLSLLFNIFRFFFTDVVFSQNIIQCVRDNVNYSILTPSDCNDPKLNLTVFQLIFSVYLLGYKISYIRDYLTLKILYKNKRIRLSIEKKGEYSVLDKFRVGQVKDNEVDQVVSIRRLIKSFDEISCDKSVGSDVHLLRYYRMEKHDKLEATAKFIEWVKLRKALGIDTIRFDILKQDISWTDIPFMKELQKVLKLQLCSSLDLDDSSVLLFCRFENDFLKFKQLVESIGGVENLKTVFFYIMEWLLLIVDSACRNYGKMFTVRVVVEVLPNNFGFIREDRKFQCFLRTVVLRYLEKVPLFWEVVYYLDPNVIVKEDSKDLLQLVDTIIPSCTSSPKVFTDRKHLQQELATEFIFVEKQVPWKLSEMYSCNTVEISFFSDVNGKDVKAVLKTKSILVNFEAKAIQLLKAGKSVLLETLSTLKREKGNLLKESTTKTSKFTTQSGATRKERRILNVEITFMELVSKGYRGTTFDCDLVNNVGILRQLREDDMDPYEAAKNIARTLKWRFKYKLHHMNTSIRKNNASIFDNKQFQEYCSISGSIPILQFDDKSKELVTLFSTKGDPSAVMNKMKPEDLDIAVRWMHEYYFVLINLLSLRERCVVKIRGISITESSIRKLGQEIAPSKDYNYYFPHSFVKPWIYISNTSFTSSKQLSKDFVVVPPKKTKEYQQYVGSYIPHHKWENRKGSAASSASKKIEISDLLSNAQLKYGESKLSELTKLIIK